VIRANGARAKARASFVLQRDYMAKAKGNRPDRDGTHRAQFDKNRAKVLATREVCGICGRPVDKTLKWPHPFSPTVDHIIPIDRGGHPSDI
jgi:5-methylcytosine-specific restriction endonuclease McrA